MNITKDGNYDITPLNHAYSSGTVYVEGTFSSAAATVNVDVNGTLTPLVSGAIAPGEQYTINHGKQAKIVLVVVGSDGSTNFTVRYNGMA